MADPLQLVARSALSPAAAAGTGARTGGLTAAVVPKAENSKARARGEKGGVPRRKRNMVAGRRGAAAAVGGGGEKLTSIRKSCNFCNARKKKCEGDGVNPCSLCIKKKRECCIYGRRRPQTPRKPKKKPLAPPTGDSQVESTLALSHPSLKRCRISASLATGLVGTKENCLLNDFFSCMGFLPLTCQSTIRSAMVNLLISAQMSGPPDLDRIVGHASGADALVSASAAPALSSQYNDPATCMFWCAVALGGLSQGRPIDSLAGYIRLAENAMAGCLGAADADVARAWALMAYLYGFCGDSENFRKCQKKAGMTLSLSSGGEGLAEQSETVDLVRHANGLCLFYGDSASSQDVESYLRHRAPHPQMNQAATGSNICRFVMQSYQRFGQAFLSDAFDQSAQIEEEGADDDALTAPLSSDDSSLGVVGNGGSGGGGRAANTAPIVWGKASSSSSSSSLGGVGCGSGGSAGGGPANSTVAMAGNMGMDPPTGSANMKKMMEQAMPEYERLEETIDGSDVRGGIGGLMINCTSVVLKAVQMDLPGSLERISRCVEVLGRFPGLMRFPMGLHISHLLISALAAMEEYELFEKLRAVYNPMRPQGRAPFPPLEEWQGIGECCSHVYCRSIESRFQKPKQATPVPEVHRGYGADALEVGPKYLAEFIEGWNTMPLPSPAPAFDTMGIGDPLYAWPPHRGSFPSNESDKEEKDFAAAEFSQALGAIRTPTVETPADLLTPTDMTPPVMTPMAMAPDNLPPAVAMTPATRRSPSVDLTAASMTPPRYGCRTRPTALLFDARSEKSRSAAAPTTTSTGTGKPSLGYGDNEYDDDSNGKGWGGGLDVPGPLGNPLGTPGTELPFNGKFLDERRDSGDIDGGNGVDSVAEVAEHYLLAGSDEETYRGLEEAVAEGTFLDTTLAMLHPQPALAHQHQQETFLSGTGL